MHHKLTDCRFSYTHTGRIQNKVPKNMLGLVEPESELECGNTELDSILRWEEDGGALFETCKLTRQSAAMNNKRKIH